MLRTLCLLTFLTPGLLFAQGKSREEKVREDRAKVEAEGFWIYNDLPRGFAEAKRTGKPLLVVLRCIPCEECVKLDDDLVDQDPIVRPLLEKFVCVRQVATNGLDLSLFQFDTDQSFAVFLMNADKTIYGRFGTRSHRTEWFGDVSLPGLAQALEGALALHADYPNNKAALAGKRGDRPLFAAPEKFPSLQAKYTATLNYQGNVVQSCIHCHQIGDAARDYFRERKQALPDEWIYPYPHPKSIGLVLDPEQRATVKEIRAATPAAEAGFQAGDQLVALEGQPLLSIADVQWVLHRVSPKGGTVTAEVDRDGRRTTLSLKLADGWRRADDISWRVSSWGYRRMTTGGLLLEELPEANRAQAGLRDSRQMALRVKHVGQYGPHAAAKQAGFQQGDILTEFDGRTDLVREADLFEYGLTKRKAGDRVTVKVLRNGKSVTLNLPMQP